MYKEIYIYIYIEREREYRGQRARTTNVQMTNATSNKIINIYASRNRLTANKESIEDEEPRALLLLCGSRTRIGEFRQRFAEVKY